MSEIRLFGSGAAALRWFRGSSFVYKLPYKPSGASHNVLP